MKAFYRKEFISFDLIGVLLSSSEPFQRILLQQLEADLNFVSVVVVVVLPVLLTDISPEGWSKFTCVHSRFTIEYIKVLEKLLPARFLVDCIS